MKILVNCRGFIGDILFASSIAKKLKEKYDNCEVDYFIPLIQPKLLLEQNPFIDRVFTLQEGNQSGGKYDLVIDIPEVDQRYPATVWMQPHAGIDDQSTEFDVWTVPAYDNWAISEIYKAGLGWNEQTQIIAYQVDWAWKAYQCTHDTLRDGTGAPHRNTDKIIDELKEHFVMIPVGFDRTISQYNPLAADDVSFAKIASLIKRCDWFIGSEGGLSNLGAAVGTKCIITTDFIYQNYGPNGRIKQIDNPMMGPAIYYPDAGHIHLDPCLTDQEILEQIINHITHHENNKRTD